MAGIMKGMGEPYQKAAKKHKVPKSGGETGSYFTQVGELDDEYKEPTPAMRITKAAQDEKVHATRKWVMGELSDRKHSQVHSRANHAIRNAKKLGK